MKPSGTSAGKRQERFHGAFTGGFSAGFFNSVGSAEGWTPSTFTSSRDKRAAPREQRPEDFMDEEDGLLTEHLQAKPQYDTLGSTAAEVARKYAEKESTGGAIPGPAPSELIMPVGDPMGKKLLRTMGWREGQGVGSRVRKRKRPSVVEGHESPDEDLPEQARAGLGEKAKALVDKGLTFAPRNTDVKAQSIVVKATLHGVGYDPFKNAPEFGSAHSGKNRGVDARGVYRTDDIVEGTGDVSGQTRPFKAPSVKRGSHGFILDDGEDDVYEAGSGKEAYDDVLDAEVGGEAPADKLAGTAKAWASGGLGGEGDSELSARRYARCPSDGRLPPTGFVVAQRPDLKSKYWAPPIPPSSFNPIHQFEEGNVDNPLRMLKKAPRTTPGMDAQGRAALLGEPGVQSGTQPTARPPVPPTQSDMPLAPGASVFSLLSPAARNKLLDAANGVRAPTSSLTTARGAQAQQVSSLQNEGARNVLANKFTSEAPANVNTGATMAVSPGGLVSAALPAGLTLRTSAKSDIASAASSLSKPRSEEAPKHVQHPVRSTLPWRPAPLLCKRLNVPVPSTPGEFDPARKDGLIGAKMAFTQGQAARESMSKFVPESSGARPAAKVPLLQGIEHHQPVGVTKEPGAPGLATVDEGAPAERPDIDLFKSIFESESESDSEPDSDSHDQAEQHPAVQPPGLLTASPLPLPAGEGARAEGWTRKRGRGYASDSSEDSSSRLGSDGGTGPVESNVSSSAVGVPSAKKKDGGDESRKHRERRRSPSSDSGRERKNDRKRSTSKRKHKKKDKSAKKDKHRKHHKRKKKY